MKESIFSVLSYLEKEHNFEYMGDDLFESTDLSGYYNSGKKVFFLDFNPSTFRIRKSLCNGVSQFSLQVESTYNFNHQTLSDFINLCLKN